MVSFSSRSLSNRRKLFVCVFLVFNVLWRTRKKTSKKKERKNVKNMYGWREHFNFCLNANKTVIKKLLSNETLKINVSTDGGKSLFPYSSLFFLCTYFPDHWGKLLPLAIVQELIAEMLHSVEWGTYNLSCCHPIHHIVAHLLFAAYQVSA